MPASPSISTSIPWLFLKASIPSFLLKQATSAHHVTFVDSASVIVLSSALGLLLVMQALAWAFGYRKSFADQKEGA